MRTPEEVMNQSVLYLRIYSYGLVFNVIYNMAAGILNAVGNSRRSLMYLAVASFSNIFLDLGLSAECTWESRVLQLQQISARYFPAFLHYGF